MHSGKFNTKTCKNCGNKIVLNQSINLTFIFFEVTIQFFLMVWALLKFSLPLFVFSVLMIFILEFLRVLLVPMVKPNNDDGAE